ncbi:MAG TPA: Xaa-Pro peptidase family protein [Capsulimonadaceae bacterium]|jgi:Xaa-Pro aminopeptidase
MTPYSQRLTNLRIAMLDAAIDAAVFTPGASMRYLTGFSEEGYERLLCLIVVADRDPVFVTPSVNAAQTEANAAGIGGVRIWGDNTGWEPMIAALAGQLELGDVTIGVDDNMAARFLLPMQRLLPGARFTSAGTVIADLRMRKDAAELAALQRAADATDAAYLAGLAACRVGATERQIARTIESAIHEAGGTLAFDTIVAASENSALPHHTPGDRALRSGDVATLDLGARIDGYCGDITRIVCIGEPSAEVAAVYDIVYRAQSAGVSAARPGVAAGAVDAATRKVIDDAGYGEQFIHRTGHGIGLDDHELPNIVAGNAHNLREGECFSIEPGIYLPGKFGTRLENIVTVTADGVRVFNAPIPAHPAVV